MPGSGPGQGFGGEALPGILWNPERSESSRSEGVALLLKCVKATAHHCQHFGECSRWQTGQ